MRFKLLMLAAAFAAVACDETNPDLTGTAPTVVPPAPVNVTTVTKSVFFPLVPSDISFEQSKALFNETSVQARVARTGTTITQLKREDFVVSENGTEVKNLKFTLQDTKAEQVVDIAFVVDVTRSMQPFISRAKSVLENFIKKSRAQGYHTRMCISTFGDKVVQHCHRFYDNDPKDKSTEKQTAELISEIAKMHAATGKPGDEDPGNNDKEENPMGALIDVSKAPWRPDAQKFVILVTDAGFLYSPDKQGVIGELAPTMAQTNQAIVNSQMTVMAVTPNMPGYTGSFQNEEGIVQKSKGKHFLFTDVVKGKQKLDDVLNLIMNSVNSTYKFTYTVEENQGLDATKAMSARQITVQFKNPATGKIEDVKSSSNFPDGRPKYTTEWKLANKDVQPSDVKVSMTVDGKSVNAPQFEVAGNTIKFKEAPAPSAKIKVVFFYADPFSNLRLTPVTLSKSMKEQQLKVTFNGVQTRTQDISIDRDTEGNISITLLPSIATTNVYRIDENNGINFKVE